VEGRTTLVECTGCMSSSNVNKGTGGRDNSLLNSVILIEQFSKGISYCDVA